MSDFVEIPASKSSLSKRKPVYGVGINDANYIVQPKINGKRITCPFYLDWKDMIKRCYSSKFHEKFPTYKECRVDKSWFIFSNFKKWMEKQNWQGMALDKDIKVIGNKLYSPDTCLFVSYSVNCLLTDSYAARGQWPIGVSFHKRTGKFHAYCSKNGKMHNLGSFTCPEQAHRVYLIFKHKVIIDASRYTDNHAIKDYLVSHANFLKEGR